MIISKNIFDVVIIGSGIAGISVGSELSKEVSVCILEKENVTSFHSTGRSFAFYLESYGSEIIRKLTSSSKDFFLKNSSSDNEIPILKSRGMIHIATEKQHGDLVKTYKDLTKINDFGITIRDLLEEDYSNFKLSEDTKGVFVYSVD